MMRTARCSALPQRPLALAATGVVRLRRLCVDWDYAPIRAGRTWTVAVCATCRSKSSLGIDGNDVIHPGLAGGLEIVRSTLLRLGLPPRDVQRYTGQVRVEHYDIGINTAEERRMLQPLINATQGLEITWLRLRPGSELAEQTLAEANLRARTGASIVAVLRPGHIVPKPKSQTVLEVDDRLGFIGEPEQISDAEALLASPVAEQQTGPSAADGP
jgi:hypothetical protein